MLGKLFGSRLAAAAVASIITAVVVGGVAVAVSSPVDSGGVIHACYNASSGAIKLQTGTKCATGLTAIAWNQQGIKGDTGATGATGPAVAPAVSVVHITASDVNGLFVPTTIATVGPLAAGRYLLSWTIRGLALNVNTWGLECTLGTSTAKVNLHDNGGTGDYPQSSSAMVLVDATSGASLGLQCQGIGGYANYHASVSSDIAVVAAS